MSVWLGSTRCVNFSYTVIDELLLPLSLTALSEGPANGPKPGTFVLNYPRQTATDLVHRCEFETVRLSHFACVAKTNIRPHH